MLLLIFFPLISWIQAVQYSVCNVGIFQPAPKAHIQGFFFFLLYSIHKMRRTEREHEDIIVAYLGHPHYTLWQQGRYKHVIHPCEEIQPFHRPEASLRELERYSYFLPFRATLIDNKIAVARQLVMKC